MGCMGYPNDQCGYCWDDEPKVGGLRSLNQVSSMGNKQIVAPTFPSKAIGDGQLNRCFFSVEAIIKKVTWMSQKVRIYWLVNGL